MRVFSSGLLIKELLATKALSWLFIELLWLSICMRNFLSLP